MNVDIEEFPTGYFGIAVGLTDADIQTLIARLQALRETRNHFHFRSDFAGAGGVGDVEFFWSEGVHPPNMTIE